MAKMSSGKVLKLAKEYANKWNVDEGTRKIIVRAYFEGYLNGVADYNIALEPIMEKLKSYHIKKVGEYKTKASTKDSNIKYHNK